MKRVGFMSRNETRSTEHAVVETTIATEFGSICTTLGATALIN